MSPDHQLMLAVRDGDVDVVFPRGIKADLVLTTVDGEIYTDFELDIMRNQEVKKIKNNNGLNSGFLLLGGDIISAKINGGGTEIKMRTIDGDIFIRKGK